MKPSRARAANLLLVSIAVALVSGTPASACSTRAPPHIDDLVPGEPIREYSEAAPLGVFEFEFIAYSPGLIVVGPRSVTVVTRYWGEPPPNLGPQMVGSDLGVLGGDGNCGQYVGGVGEVGYWWADSRSVDRPDWPRSSLTIDGIGVSITSEQGAMLEERFGSPVVVGVSASDRVVGSLMAWQWQLIALVAVAGLVGGIRLLRRRTRRQAPV